MKRIQAILFFMLVSTVISWTQPSPPPKQKERSPWAPARKPPPPTQSGTQSQPARNQPARSQPAQRLPTQTQPAQRLPVQSQPVIRRGTQGSSYGSRRNYANERVPRPYNRAETYYQSPFYYQSPSYYPSAASFRPLPEPLDFTLYNPSYGLYFRPEPAPVPIYRDLSEPIDDADLLNWVIDNASKGSTWAATELGMRYLEGRGVKQNFEVGKTWLVKSAKEGDNEAYTVLKNTDFPSESPNATPKKDYMEATGWPSGKPGYVIMLKREPDKGGTYSVDNMQWLPIEDAKKKDPLLIDALKKTLKEN